MNFFQKKKQAFTLVEMVAAIVLLGFLVVVVFSLLEDTKKTSKTASDIVRFQRTAATALDKNFKAPFFWAKAQEQEFNVEDVFKSYNPPAGMTKDLQQIKSLSDASGGSGTALGTPSGITGTWIWRVTLVDNDSGQGVSVYLVE